ncbi:MAG: hypothetical protein FK733_10600, partial [Asgard group archaeon]|nr:hypothetical protein [Asgard group archaeon]
MCMNKKKWLAILVPIISLIVIFVPLGTIYVHYFEGHHDVHLEQYLSDIHPSEMGVEEFIEDFEFFYNLMKDNYHFFDVKERILGYDWLDFKEDYLARINACSNTTEFLEVMFDAITALQNLHTSILSPADASTYYESALRYDRYLQYSIINEEVVGYNEYWIDIYNEVIDRRYNHLDNLLIVNKDERNVLLYNLLMVYDRGDYIVYDGWESWLDYYNLTLGSKVIAVDDVPIHEAVSNSFERSYLFYDYSLNRSYIQFLAP